MEELRRREEFAQQLGGAGAGGGEAAGGGEGGWRRREGFARQLGGPERVERQHAGGRYTVRERIAKLADPGSFHELGKIAGRAPFDARTEPQEVLRSQCQ